MIEQRLSCQGAVLAFTVVLGLIPASAPAAQGDVGNASTSQPSASAPDLINADRPGIADGSSVIARGLVQAEVGFQRERREDAQISTRTSFLPTLLRVGLGAGWEGRAETNVYTWMDTDDPTGTNHSSGWSPSSVGVKYQIRDSDNTQRVSLGMIGRVFPVSGSGSMRSGRLTGDLRLAADVDVSRTVTLNPNVGIARYEDGSGKAFAATLLAVTVTLLPSDRLMPFLDLGYQTPIEINGPASLVFDAGLAYIAGRNVQFDVSFGTGAHGPAPRPFVSFGISLRSSR